MVEGHTRTNSISKHSHIAKKITLKLLQGKKKIKWSETIRFFSTQASARFMPASRALQVNTQCVLLKTDWSQKINSKDRSWFWIEVRNWVNGGHFRCYFWSFFLSFFLFICAFREFCLPISYLAASFTENTTEMKINPTGQSA